MARLLIQPGTSEERTVNLRPGQNTFGRGAGNDFIINDPSVSGSHCEILVQERSTKIIDLGSTNGTFVGQKQITEHILDSGVPIRLGNVELIFEPATVKLRIPSPNSAVDTPPEAATNQPAAGRLRVAAMSASSQPDGTPGSGQTSAPPLAHYVVDGPVYCKFHPKSRAAHWCHQCGKAYCDLCISTRRDQNTVHHICRACSSECVPVKADFSADGKKTKTFFRSVPGAFAYPFRKEGVLILIVATIIFACLGFLARFGFMFGLMFAVILYGYLFAYMQNIVHSTANGDESSPELPDATELYQDIIVPFFQLLIIFGVCFGPALLILGFYSGQTWGPTAAVTAGLLGAVYFPMAFLAVVMFDTVGALNPVLVIPSILRVPLQYSVAILLLLVVAGMQAIASLLLPILLPFPFIPNLIGEFFSLYFLTVNIRVLGLLYYTNRRKLGWFKRR